MFYSSYFPLLLCFCFIRSSFGNDLMNAGFMMNNDDEELVCSVTCIKKHKTPCDNDGGSTTTTKRPCPLTNTTLPPTTALPPTTRTPMPPTSTLPSTIPPSTILPSTTTPSTLPPSTTRTSTLPSSTPKGNDTCVDKFNNCQQYDAKIYCDPVRNSPEGYAWQMENCAKHCGACSPGSSTLPTLLPSTTTTSTLPPSTIRASTIPPTSTALPSTTTSTPPTLPPSTCGNKTKTVCMNGDPHYTTWDWAYFDYHGTCPYNFVSPCAPNAIVGFENFSVKAQNKIYSTNPTPIAVVDSVLFEIHQQKIYMTLLGDLYVNEQRQYYPYFYPDATNPLITIRQNGWLKTVETAKGINLEFNGYSLCVTIPDCAPFYGKDKLCGLAGNYDGNCTNDVQYKNGTAPAPLIPCRFDNTVSDWANSFVVNDYFYPNNATKECSLGSNSNGCDRIKSGSFDKCKPIMDSAKGSGIFKRCQGMGNEVIERMFQACAADVCMMPDYLCKSFEDFAIECQRMLNGTSLANWRVPVGCAAVQCPANSSFKPCVSSCQPTCQDPTLKPTCDNTICIEGCQCDIGYVIDNTKTALTCVKKENCDGCFDENTGLSHTSPNDPWITKNCTTFNTCWKGKRISRTYQCDASEKCITKDKAEGCQSSKCPEGWRYNGKTGACFKTIYNVSFDQAEAKCQTFGAHLTSITTAEENEFIRGMLYIGTNDVQLVDDTYIGLSGPDGKFTWTDATPFNYSNGAIYPDGFGVEQKVPKYCWFMLSDNHAPHYSYLQGQWYIGNCERVLRTAVCKKRP